MLKRPWILLASCIALSACEEPAPTPTSTSSTGSTKPSAPKPSASGSATTKPSAAPSASAAPAGAFKCPDGSTGEGTSDKPCMATGQTRLIEMKWTGKYNADGKPTFSLKNPLAFDLLGADVDVYFYDKDGKQLDTLKLDGKATQMYWHSSGGVFSGGPLKASESRDAETVGLDPFQVPAGTVNVEADVPSVSFRAVAGGPLNSWQNDDLRPKGGKRDQIGKAPADAQPAPPTAGKKP